MQTPTELDVFSSNDQDETLGAAAQRTLDGYFQSLNQEQFDETASLFSNEGALVPPFAKPIQGRAAIAAYLKKEAVGITLVPHSWTRVAKKTDLPTGSKSELEKRDALRSAYCVKGKVKTSLFTVNVAWNFRLNADAEIDAVEVKLLASMKELMAMQPQS